MKRKLFCLLTLLLAVCSGAWATDNVSFGFESGTIADVFSISASSGVTNSIETISTYEWSSGKKYSGTPDGSTKLLVCSLGTTKGNSSNFVTKNSYTAISSISFYIASSDRGKTELAVQISPTSDFSESITTVLAQKTLSETDFGGTSNGTMKKLTFPVSNITGYVRIILAQASGSNNKSMALDDVEITYTAAPTKTNTVTFNAGSNGSCGTTSLTEASIGAGVTLPAVSANSGYAFNGWYTGTGAFAGIAGTNYKPSNDITLDAQYLADATFLPVSGSDVEGQSNITVTSTGATSIKYAWTETESAPAAGDYTSVAATEGSATIPVPNVTATRYLYVKGAMAEGNDGNVMHASYGITQVKVAAGLAYSTTTIKKYSDAAAFTNTLTNPNSLSITYDSSDKSVATVNSDGEVSIVGVGTTTISATSAETSDYLAGYAAYTLTVRERPVLTVESNKTWNFSDDVWGEITGESNAFTETLIVDNLEQITDGTEDVYVHTSGSQSFSDGYSSSAYLYYGAVSANRRQIHIKVAGQSKISVYVRAGGDGRKVKVNKNFVNGSNPDDLIGTEQNAPKSTNQILYFNYLGESATDAYIYNSGSNGLNIYGIKVEPLSPSITTQPIGASYEKDAVATPIAVVASAANEGELSYQWYSNSSATTEGAIELVGETAANYTPSTTALGTTYYYCVVTEEGISATATSNIVAVSVVSSVDYDAPMATLRPTDGTSTDVVIPNFVSKDFTLTSSATINKSNWGENFLNTLKVSGSVTITANSNAMIQAIKVYGMSNNNSGGTTTISAASGATGSGTLQARNDEGNLSEITVTANNPAANNSVSFTLTGQSRIYVVVYGMASITANKEYTTLTSHYDLDFTDVEGLKPYVVTADISDNKVTLSQRNKMGAGNGMVLKAEPAGKSYLIPIFTGAADNVAGNKMVGSATETTAIAENGGYILKDGIFQPSAEGSLPAGKAYLNIPVGPNARSLTIGFEDEGETTAISEVRGLKADVRGEFYNLNGQRVAQPTKGLYIVNGRKVVIK